MKEILHITNGDVLTRKLLEFGIKGDILTWSEMLCEGPTEATIDTDSFLKKRSDFFEVYYNLEFDKEKFHLDINKLNKPENYTSVVLWFEYDLFCHINMVAVISLLKQKHIDLPLYLVCSGRIKGEKSLKGLAELHQNQLLKHYKNKIQLQPEDIELATTIWDTYCGKDHNLLKPLIVTKSSFTYLSNCLKAHLERFPDFNSGLSVLERNILVIVRDHSIKSRHHLLGYVLNYQGYYGYGDLQINRLINKLSIFLDEDNQGIILNHKGHMALLEQHNFSSEINNNIQYGGINRLDFQFSKQKNQLIKSSINVH